MGTFLVILAGVCWGVISIFINAFDGAGFDSFDIMCLRTWISAIILFLIMAVFDRDKLKIKLKDLWMFIGTGLLSLTFFSYCYFTSIVESGTAVSVVLLYTSPVFVMIMGALFFKEKITRNKLIALIMTIAGCVLVTGLVGNSNIGLGVRGILLGLGAGFGYALYSLFAGFALKKYASLTITFYTFLLSGMVLLFVRNPADLIENVDLKLWPYAIGIAVICTVVPYITYTIGMSKMEIGRAAVLVTVEPLVGCVIGIFVWGESAGWMKVLGIVMILLAVVILSIQQDA